MSLLSSRTGTAAGVATLAFASVALWLAACDSSPSAESQGKTIEVVSAVPDTTLTALDDTLFVDMLPYFRQVNGEALSFRVARSGADFIDVSIDESTGRLAAVSHDAGGTSIVSVVVSDPDRTRVQVTFAIHGPNLCPPDPLAVEDSFFPLGPDYSAVFDYVDEYYYFGAPYNTRQSGIVHWQFDSTDECLDSRSQRFVLRQTRAYVVQSGYTGHWETVSDTIRSESTTDVLLYSDEVLFNMWFPTKPLRWRFPFAASDSMSSSTDDFPVDTAERKTLRATFVRDVGVVRLSWFHVMHRDDYKVTLTRRD